MRYSFRLAEVVGHVPHPRRRPGTIKAICDYTGLDRHQVAALLKNELKYIPLDAMSKLCAYLIDRGYAKADELPGRLFGVEPEHFWELLARRRRLELCLGVRRGEATDTLDDAWVVASDSVLLGELLNGATTLGGTAEHRRQGSGSGAPAIRSPNDRPHPEYLRQSLVWSPGQATLAECQQMARSVYESFGETAGDKALVCLGSNKSNPVVETMVAAAFGCAPFVSQDKVAEPGERQCPLFLRYRDHDPQFPSCFGGVHLAQHHATTTPGIYFERPDGSWECCAWGPTEDAAFVFYVHRESQGRLEMALGGFSGRATRLLAGLLARRGEEFWPPVYADEGLQVGTFVVRFRLTGPPEEHLEKSAEPLPAEAEIVRLDGSVIGRRLEHPDLPPKGPRAAAKSGT